MSDRIVINMPTDPYQFMIGMAVAQEFQLHLHLGAEKETRDGDFTVTFKMEEKFKYLEPCLQVLKTSPPIYDYMGWYEKGRGDYDCFIDFDFPRAIYAVSKNRKHITEGFGALIGTYTNALQYAVVPQKQPILKPLLLPKGKGGVLVVEWSKEETNKFASFLRNNYPELTIETTSKGTGGSIEAIIKYVNDFDVVIGGHSLETYIAASLEKPLIEIFPTDEEAFLYNNDTIPVYEASIGNTSAEYMWVIWEEVWEKLLEGSLNIPHQGRPVSMEPVLSTVTGVVEKSLDNLDRL